MFQTNNIGSEDTFADSLSDDFRAHLQATIDNMKDKSGEEYQKYVQELERLDYERALKKEAKNTTASAILKYMLVGFIVIFLVPFKYISRFKEHVELKDEFRFIREKLFKNTKIYRLNAGK